MINPEWLELPMSRTIFYGPKDVRAIEIRLYILRIPRVTSYGVFIFSLHVLLEHIPSGHVSKQRRINVNATSPIGHMTVIQCRINVDAASCVLWVVKSVNLITEVNFCPRQRRSATNRVISTFKTKNALTFCFDILPDQANFQLARNVTVLGVMLF